MTHDERVWHHEMETLEGIHEHAERIASLEEFVEDMLLNMRGCALRGEPLRLREFACKTRELGIEP